MKQFGILPLSKRGPLLSTNPPISKQFFHDPPPPSLSKFQRQETPALILGGRKL